MFRNFCSRWKQLRGSCEVSINGHRPVHGEVENVVAAVGEEERMHQAIVESLEEYIGGGITPAAQRDSDAHLEPCEECRREVSSMLDISGMFETLRPAGEILPSAGFCARVMQPVARPQVPSFWSLFSLDASFGRRVVFASL